MIEDLRDPLRRQRLKREIANALEDKISLEQQLAAKRR